MNNFIYSSVITFLAGISTLLGGFISFFKIKENLIVLSSLAFASGIMLSISLLDLLPSAFKQLLYIYGLKGVFLLVLFFFLGGVVFFILDKLLTDSGDNLYRVGFFSMIAIIIHNIPEGILTFLLSSNNLELGLIMALSIALHNVPEGISIMIPIYYSTGSRKKAFLFTIVAGLSEFVGGVLFYILFGKYMNSLMFGFLFSFISGVMIYLSLFELIPKSFEYKKINLSVLFFMIGILFFLVVHIFLH